MVVKRINLLSLVMMFIFSITFLLVFVMGGMNVYGAMVSGEAAPNTVTAPIGKYASGSGEAVVLMYHHIATDEEIDSGIYDGNNAIVGESQYEEEMKYLAENGYTTLLVSELAAILENGLDMPEKAVVITFDDGYESNYTRAYPIMEKYNLKMTIGIVVKSTEDLEYDIANEASDISLGLPHVTFEQCREMIASGLVEIGSHSYDGHIYVDIDAEGTQGKFFVARMWLEDEGRIETYQEYVDRITYDVSKSKLMLEQELGVEIKYFVYPYGTTNDVMVGVLERAGYSIAITTKSGFVTSDDVENMFKINRKNVNQGITLMQFMDLLPE